MEYKCTTKENTIVDTSSLSVETLKIRISHEKHLKSFCDKYNFDINKINTECYEKVSKDYNNTNWDKLPEYKFNTDKWIIINTKGIEKNYFDGIEFFKNSGWYPSKPQHSSKYIIRGNVQPEYPFFIISLGRYMFNDTFNSLIELGITNVKVVVEPSEYDKYVDKIGKDFVIKLSEDYHLRKEGSKHARNFVHNHSINNKYKHYWLLDDNIKGFYFFQNNERIKIDDGFTFYYLEKFMNKFTNSYIGGMSYYSDVPEIDKRRHIIHLNSKVYSCFLINTEISNIITGDLWKGIYNEDIILCIELLKKGYPTFTTTQFLCNKLSTGNRKGGNQVNLYKDTNEKTWDEIKTQYLMDYFQEYSNTVIKFSDKRKKKYHHSIDWKKINNDLKLILRPDIDEYNKTIKPVNLTRQLI